MLIVGILKAQKNITCSFIDVFPSSLFFLDGFKNNCNNTIDKIWNLAFSFNHIPRHFPQNITYSTVVLF